MTYTIDTEICTFCGLCAAECPPGIISLNKENGKALIDHDNCIECSHCGMVCPVNAVRVDGKKLREYPDAVEDIEPARLEHLINTKRSVRHYKHEPVSREDLDAILIAGSLSATATNSQQVKPIILQGDEVRSASAMIAGVLLRVVRFGLNPAGRLIIKLAGLGRYARRSLLEDYHRRIIDTIEGRADIFFFNAPAVVVLTYKNNSNGKRFGRTDCALAGQNMMLAAHNRGIGSCMIGFAEAALITKGLRKKIGVTPDRRIGLIFTLGYQKAKYFRYPERASWEY